MYQGIIERYREFLPVTDTTPLISLHEGGTPLLRAHNLEKVFPGITIYLKYDGLNPTGSFKDRGMTMAVSKAVEAGSQALICASTGNTSASAAAYGAKAGLKVFVLIPDNKIAMGKLAQAVAYGAEIIPIQGNFDEALQLVRDIAAKESITLVNSVNPYRIEGQKSAAFEIIDDLGEAPDYLFIPVGNAGNITAYWQGFKEYQQTGHSTVLPQLYGYQAAGAAPMVLGHPVSNPETIATAIRIGNPASWDKAQTALTESSGHIASRTDDEIMLAYSLLAAKEGIFAEPASCISIAGLQQAYREGQVREGSVVVCVLTGNGLKDPDSALTLHDSFTPLKADYGSITKHILGITNQ